MAVPVVCVQPHTSAASDMECPLAVNDCVLVGHPINYCCSLLILHLFAVVSVYVICHQKYCMWVIDFGFRLVELRKLVVHQVEVRTHMA